jgi:hypothetical protein
MGGRMGESSLRPVRSGAADGCVPVVGAARGRSLDAADAWVRFVETRDCYNRLSADRNADPTALAAAREAMQEAYLSWSSH